MKQAAVYVRSARSSPATLERQLRRCAQAAKREGFVLDADLTFVDVGLSGNSPPEQRPGYRRMAKVLRAGAVDTLVVSDVSRLSRSVKHLAEVLTWLHEARIRVICADGSCLGRGMAERVLVMSLRLGGVPS